MRRTNLAARWAVLSSATALFFYVGAEQDYLNIPYWTEFAAAGPRSHGFRTRWRLLQQQIVGNSDPTAVFARTDFLLNRATR